MVNTELKNLWRIGGLAGMITASTIPIFLLMFAIVFPALGFDLEKFFEAEDFGFLSLNQKIVTTWDSPTK